MCIHEAGHVVLANQLRIIVTRVVVRNSSNWRKATTFFKIPQDIDTYFDERYVYVVLAGRASEIIHKTKRTWSANRETEDLAVILFENMDYENLSRTTPDELNAIINTLRNETLRLMRSRHIFISVHNIAQYLFKTKHPKIRVIHQILRNPKRILYRRRLSSWQIFKQIGEGD